MDTDVQFECRTVCRDSGWKAQFGHPTGWGGWAVGHLMALKNAGLGRVAVELLEIGPEDRVLEIGFGPGKAIQEATRRVVHGRVAGVDPSEEMLRQATQRNGRGVVEGRVDLRLGRAEALPFADGSFTRVFEVNSFHHWDSPRRGLREIHRVLAGGRLLLGLRLKRPTRLLPSAPGYSPKEVERVAALVEEAGFRRVRVVMREAGRKLACILADREATSW